MTTTACLRCGAERANRTLPCSRCGWDEPVAAVPTTRRGYRPWLLLGGGAAAVLAGLGVTAGLLVGGDGSAPSAPLDTRERDAHDVAAALGRLADDPGGLRASTTSLDTVDPRTALPAGSTVSPDRSTWTPDGAGGGVMTVAITHAGMSRQYQAVMVQENGAWKVLATFPLPTAASASTPTPTGSPS